MLQIINPSSPKLEQFIKEFNQLLENYQYDMVAVMEYRKGGILPAIEMVDVPPKETVMSKVDEPVIEPVSEELGGVPNGHE